MSEGTVTNRGPLFKFRDTEVVVTDPANPSTPPLIINTSDAVAATVGEVPSAVDTIEISWKRSTARDHSEPGDAQMVLILDTPTHPLIRWDTEVTITTTPAWWDNGWHSTGSVLVWHGWITQTAYRERRLRHPDTGAQIVTWEHTVTMTDLVGRAGSTKIGDSPWPEEGPLDRIQHIRDAAPYPVLDPDPLPENWSSSMIAARDIDNIALLDPIQKLAASLLLTAHPGPAGMQLHTTPGNALGAMWGQATDNRLPSLTLPASVLTQAARHVDRGNRVTAVTISYVEADGTDRNNTSLTVRDPDALATSEAKLDTDQVDFGGSTPTLDAHIAWANSVITMTRTPITVLEPVEVILDRIADLAGLETVTALVALGGRSSALLQIDNPPADIYGAQHVIAGTLTLTGRRDKLTLTLAPTLLNGQKALVWADIPDTNPSNEPMVWGRTPHDCTWGRNTASTLPPSGA